MSRTAPEIEDRPTEAPRAHPDAAGRLDDRVDDRFGDLHLDPASDPAGAPVIALPEWARDAVEGFPFDEMVELVLERCSDTNFSDHMHDEEFLDRLRASITQNAYALRDVIAGRSRLGDLELDRVLGFATVQAHLRIPQKSMQRSYRISFFIQWEMWTAHVQAWLEEHGHGGSESLEVLCRLTRLILTYQDHVASRVAEVHTRDQDALNRSRVHVRHSLVRDVLRGEENRLTASDLAVLAYPLDAHHVAVLLPDMPEGAATQLANGLRTAARAHQTLVYPLSLGSTVIWLGRHEPWRTESLQPLTELLCKLGATASVSNPASGYAGFSTCLRQAEETERVRSAWGAALAPPVIRYADAGLEILLMQDTQLARTFVDAELGALAQDTTEGARLRETLEASFRFGSHVAAAEHLGLHEHTVRNRLHKAEVLLGHSLQERRTELQVAVRLVRLLGGRTEQQG